MNGFDVASYYHKRKQYLQEEISEKEWSDFCMKMLKKLMKEHKETFERLKGE